MPFPSVIAVLAIPKVGDTLPVAVGSGRTPESKVARVDWIDDCNLVTVSCHREPIDLAAEHGDQVIDPTWEMKPLKE